LAGEDRVSIPVSQARVKSIALPWSFAKAGSGFIDEEEQSREDQ